MFGHKSHGVHVKCTPNLAADWLTLQLSSIVYRAAAFDVAGCKTSATLSVIFRFTHKTARQESSKFYSDLRNASSLELTKYYCINCHCSTVTMPIKLSSYGTWSTSETVASVQLPLNAVFFCLAEVVSHVILWRQCSHSISATCYTWEVSTLAVCFLTQAPIYLYTMMAFLCRNVADTMMAFLCGNVADATMAFMCGNVAYTTMAFLCREHIMACLCVLCRPSAYQMVVVQLVALWQPWADAHTMQTAM